MLFYWKSQTWEYSWPVLRILPNSLSNSYNVDSPEKRVLIFILLFEVTKKRLPCNKQKQERLASIDLFTVSDAILFGCNHNRNYSKCMGKGNFIHGKFAFWRHWVKEYTDCLWGKQVRRYGLVDSALNSAASGPGSSPGRGHLALYTVPLSIKV